MRLMPLLPDSIPPSPAEIALEERITERLRRQWIRSLPPQPCRDLTDPFDLCSVCWTDHTDKDTAS